jgi:pilus assembly protein Flp/PilA
MLLDYVRTVLALKLDKRAVTAMEYGLIAALIAVVIIAAVSTVGTNLKSTFNTVASEL